MGTVDARYGFLLTSLLTAAAIGFLFNYILCMGLGASPEPVAALGGPSRPAGLLLDYAEVPLQASSGCLGGAVEGAIIGALAAFAAVAPVRGSGGPEPGGNGGQDIGFDNTVPAGGNGEPPGGGEPPAGNGGSGNGGGGAGDGGGDGSNGGGGEDPNGAGQPEEYSNPAADAARQRVYEAFAKGDRDGAFDALRDMFRAATKIPDEEKALLAPPGTGAAPSKLTGIGSAGESTSIKSPLAISVNPFAPGAVIPIDESAGGLDQTVQVLGGNK